MTRIFISYRREDSSGHTGRLNDRLSARFGRSTVFIDIETIEPGENFAEVIQQAVSSCDLLVAVIGQQWSMARNANGLRRLDDPNDIVRLEIATAFRREIKVIPVLVQGATLPDEHELPDDLKGLKRLNAFEISDARWEYDVQRLLEAIQKILKPKSSVTRTKRLRVAILVLTFSSTLTVVLLLHYSDFFEPPAIREAIETAPISHIDDSDIFPSGPLTMSVSNLGFTVFKDDRAVLSWAGKNFRNTKTTFLDISEESVLRPILNSSKNVGELLNRLRNGGYRLVTKFQSVGLGFPVSVKAPLEEQKQEAFVVAFFVAVRNLAEAIYKPIPTQTKNLLVSSLRASIGGIDLETQIIIENYMQVKDLLRTYYHNEPVLIENYKLVFPPIDLLEFPTWKQPPDQISEINIANVHFLPDGACEVKVSYSVDPFKLTRVLKRQTQPKAFTYEKDLSGHKIFQTVSIDAVARGGGDEAPSTIQQRALSDAMIKAVERVNGKIVEALSKENPKFTRDRLFSEMLGELTVLKKNFNRNSHPKEITK